MWHTTLSLEELTPGQKKKVNVAKTELMIVNVGGNVYATQLSCTHAQSDLTEGTLEGCVIECGLHGAMFDVTDGRVLSLPAILPLKVYPTKIENGVVMIELPE